MLFQQVLNGLVAGGIYAMVALGLTLIFGIMRVPNFAHGTTYMIGAYFTYFIIERLEVNLFLGISLAFVLVAVLGFLIEKVVFKPVSNRPTMDAFIIALGLWVVMENVALYLWGPETRIISGGYGDKVIRFLTLTITVNRIIILVGSIVLILAIYLFIKKTKYGKAMQAVAEDKIASALVGISPRRVLGFTFAIGSGLAAAAGGLVGSSFSIFPEMGGMPILKAFCAIVLGGMGSVSGAIFGSFILGLAESLGAAYITSSYKDAFAFIILITVLIIRPHGLLGKEEEERR